MKTIVIALSLMLSMSLYAEEKTSTLECSFTEPFFTLDINLNERTIHKTEPDWNGDPSKTITTLINEDVSLVSDFSDPLLPKYEITSTKGEAIMSLVLNMSGSDGMSDIIFPFDARYGELWGGCSSDKIAPFNPYEAN